MGKKPGLYDRLIADEEEVASWTTDSSQAEGDCFNFDDEGEDDEKRESAVKPNKPG